MVRYTGRVHTMLHSKSTGLKYLIVCHIGLLSWPGILHTTSHSDGCFISAWNTAYYATLVPMFSWPGILHFTPNSYGMLYWPGTPLPHNQILRYWPGIPHTTPHSDSTLYWPGTPHTTPYSDTVVRYTGLAHHILCHIQTGRYPGLVYCILRCIPTVRYPGLAYRILHHIQTVRYPGLANHILCHILTVCYPGVPYYATFQQRQYVFLDWHTAYNPTFRQGIKLIECSAWLYLYLYIARYVSEGRFVGKDQSLMAATCLETNLCLLLDGTSNSRFRPSHTP